MPSKRLVYTRDQMQRIWRATQQVERSRSGRDRELSEPLADSIYFRNDSAQTIPPYGLMQASTTLDVTDSYNLILVERPIDATLMRCPLLVNGDNEVLAGEYGSAQTGPVYRILHDAAHTYVAGDRMGSLTATFTATRGSIFAVLGADAVATNVVRCMFDTSSWRGRTIATLVAGTPGNVYVYDAAGTLTSKQYLAETAVSNISAVTEILLVSMYGRWFASEVC